MDLCQNKSTLFYATRHVACAGVTASSLAGLTPDVTGRIEATGHVASGWHSGHDAHRGCCWTTIFRSLFLCTSWQCSVALAAGCGLGRDGRPGFACYVLPEGLVDR